MWTLAKIVALFLIFGLSFLSGIFACVAVKWLIRKYGLSGHFTHVISLLNCFSGGVFFATAILNLLPEAREKMENALKLWGLDTGYPLTEFLTGFGFLLILVFENISHFCCDLHHSNNDAHSNEKYKNDTRVTYTIIPSAVDDDSESDEVHVGDFKESSTYQRYTGNRARKDSITECDLNQHEEHTQNNGLQTHNQEVPGDTSQDIKKRLSRNVEEGLPKDTTKSRIRGIVLLVALSFHMVFDGLALGLLDKDEEVWELLLALCVHKVLMFVSVGLEVFALLKSLCKSVLIMLYFALMSPTGIIIGVAVISGDDELTRDAAAAILQGIATGTFIYVTFFEILLREFNEDSHDLLKVLATVIGFSLVGGVKLLEGDTEG